MVGLLGIMFHLICVKEGRKGLLSDRCEERIVRVVCWDYLD